jgi:hypothetical protein
MGTQLALEDLARGGARQRLPQDAQVAGDLEPRQVAGQEISQDVGIEGLANMHVAPTSSPRRSSGTE